MLTLEDIKTILNEEVQKLHKIGINPIKVTEVRIIKSRSFYADACRYDACIRVSYYYLEAPKEEVRGTLMHELLHMVSSSGKGHGREWKELAVRVNKAYPQYDIKRVGSQLRNGHVWSLLNSPSEKPKTIKIICPKCHATWIRIRNSNLTIHPEQYRCGNCNTPLERVK